MIEGAMEKPIDEIRYPNVAKQTRRLMILATVEFVALKSELLADAQRRGYDTDKLIWVRQGKDKTTRSVVK